ncbi:hypothetical protein SAMN05216244_2495 [Sediminibacillus halophilus]|uniref:Uncharacterized protein n=1 Tax=Sediminibacillus halophilus TaxID=482461 RepID=A0A1G9T9V3_9BACI|nr:hypothetical protein SAMN05216244_2495 [Sediminibacillus halophilus]
MIVGTSSERWNQHGAPKFLMTLHCLLALLFEHEDEHAGLNPLSLSSECRNSESVELTWIVSKCKIFRGLMYGYL